jgi:hypothetical protein
MPVTINGDGSITGLSVGGLGSGVVNTATLADGAATGIKLGSGSVIQVQGGIENSQEQKLADQFTSGPDPNLIPVAAPSARVAVFTTPEPRPPTESPVILPSPLIVTGIRFFTP